jgi:CRISPR-associated protein Csd1
MSLSALAAYYERTVGTEDGPPALAYAAVPVVAALTLAEDGSLVGLLDLRVEVTRGKAAKLVPRRMVVPQPPKRTVAVVAGFLCDNAGYLLGFDGKGNPTRAAQQFAAAKALHERLLHGIDEPMARAILAFFRRWDPAGAAKFLEPESDEAATGWLVFRSARSGDYAHDQPAIRRAWEAHAAAEEGPRGQCLVTGAEDVAIAAVHPAIKGVPGAQSSGAALVSFNLEAFTSYGRTQNLNAPIGSRAAFAYTTALNHLLRPDSPQKFQLGDTVVIVWSDRKTPVESELSTLFGAPQQDEKAERVRGLLERIARGRWAEDEIFREAVADGIEINVLGLAPNAARLQIRFYFVNTLEHLLINLQNHCRDLLFDDPRALGHIPTLRQLALETFPKDEDGRARIDDGTKKALDRLHAELFQAVLQGQDYPQTLVPVLLARLRSDRVLNSNRIGLLKACINRRRRFARDPAEPEIPMGLDETNSEPGYLLGRLFATLERMQEVSRGVEGRDQPTIRDRFAGAAAATPRGIFPHLLGLEPAHTKKAKRVNPKLAFWLQRQIAEILGRVDSASGFPSQLDPQQQGLFYIGYYQQKWHRNKAADPEGDTADDEAQEGTNP